MPSVRYYNQTAPFWDFVASMEEQARTHAAASGPNENNHHQEGTEPEPENENENENENANPWEGMYFPFGPFAHRGRRGHGPHGRHGHGPPPPPPPPPAHPHDHEMTGGDEKEHDPEEGPSHPRGPHNHGPGPHPRGPHGHGPGPHDHGHHKAGFGGPGGRGGRCGGRGGRGRWGGRGGPMGGFGGFAGLADAFQSHFFDGDNAISKTGEDFQPEVDVFDAPENFVVHVSLPGAKKEDVGVNWDAEKSELSIAGVIYRPGDEEFLKTLALDERKIGAFERKVRLGSRANPAQIDVDGITAKMEDGVLRVEVPKLDAGYVEIKKVDIE